MSIITCQLEIQGMHCIGCETAIENAVESLPGVEKVSAHFHRDMAKIRFDNDKVSIAEIFARIEQLGYRPGFTTQTKTFKSNLWQRAKPHWFDSGTIKQVLTALLALNGILAIIWLDSWFMDHAEMPELNRDISFSLLFLIGFLTSFHCVGMCGPFIIGYSAKTAGITQRKPHFSHFCYGVGKTLSYTAIGGLFGAFGAVIAFTPYTQGAAGFAAGVFLILYGLHMLKLFPALNRFQIGMPIFVKRFIGDEYRKHSNPFAIGLLNGLMILCGPLQAMYIMAAGTGNWVEGAFILLFFGLGTLPLLMGLGFLTSLASSSFTPKLLKASGYLIIVLGAIMLNRGLTVTGAGFDFNTAVTRLAQQLAPARLEAPANNTEQIIEMDVVAKGYLPNKFTLRKGVPVRWVINGKEVNECNKEIVVPQYHLTIKVNTGTQIVKFTPPETGIVPWSCWMGMIPGTFVVVENTPSSRTENNAGVSLSNPKPSISYFYKQLIEGLQDRLRR